MDEAFLASGQAKVTLYRVRLDDPDRRPVVVDAALPARTSGSGVDWQGAVPGPGGGLAGRGERVRGELAGDDPSPGRRPVSAPVRPLCGGRRRIQRAGEVGRVGA